MAVPDKKSYWQWKMPTMVLKNGCMAKKWPTVIFFFLKKIPCNVCRKLYGLLNKKILPPESMLSKMDKIYKETKVLMPSGSFCDVRLASNYSKN